MALKTDCQTPGAQFHTHLQGRKAQISVTLPFDLQLTQEQAALLEANLHNAVELVLAPYFVKRSAFEQEG